MEGDTCIPRKNLYQYGYKIYELQRKQKINEDIMIHKDSMIIYKNEQIRLYKSNIFEKDIIISNYKQNDSLKKDLIKLQEVRIEELEPKWYNNDPMWFGVGFVLGIIVVLL
jgi:hypothetical protein